MFLKSYKFLLILKIITLMLVILMIIYEVCVCVDLVIVRPNKRSVR